MDEIVLKIISQFEPSDKLKGDFIFGDEIPSGIIMRRLGFVPDLRKVGGKAKRGFWVKRVSPTTQEISDKLNNLPSGVATGNRDKKKYADKKIRFTKSAYQAISRHNHGLTNKEAEERILKNIQRAEMFKGILVSPDDVNMRLFDFQFGKTAMRRLLVSLNFIAYKNYFWIKENELFENRIVIPKYYMQDKIDELKSYNRDYSLCPDCRGLCTNEYRCYKCFGQKIIKTSEYDIYR